MSEMWQEICFLLDESISQSISEGLFAQRIIQALEKLGWSQFRGEISLTESHQLGSAGRIIPDITVKSPQNGNLFVIEVKKPSVDIDNFLHKNQLFSYMRQLKLDFGLLIGQKIQIFYDGRLNLSDNPALLKTFEISRANSTGNLFVDLFGKDGFSHDRLNEFAETTLSELAKSQRKHELRRKLFSPEYQQNVVRLIANDLVGDWDEEAVKEILGQINISIVASSDFRANDPAAPFSGSEIADHGQKISQLVKTHIPLIISYCERDSNELDNLLSPDYSKKTFNINYPFFRKLPPNAPKQDRYWRQVYTIHNENYVATSEWFKGSTPLFKDYIARLKNRAPDIFYLNP